MDKEKKAATIMEISPKTSEESEMRRQNTPDLNENPSNSKEANTGDREASPGSATIERYSPDETRRRNQNENDLNSEDIVLKWDDDSDMDVSLAGDFVLDIENDNTIKSQKGGESTKSGVGEILTQSADIGDYERTKDKENDGIELIDVARSEIDEITDQIDELIKKDDSEASSRINIDASYIEEKAPASNDNTAINKVSEGLTDDSTSEMAGIAQESVKEIKLQCVSEETTKEASVSSEPTSGTDKDISITTVEPNSPNESPHTTTETDDLDKDYLLTNLSIVEDNNQTAPSKEEEDILLAEPTSTDNQLDTEISKASNIQPDISDAILDVSVAAKDIPDTPKMPVDDSDGREATDNSSLVPESTTKADASKDQPTDAEKMEIDIFNDIQENADNKDLVTDSTTKDAPKEQSDMEKMAWSDSGDPSNISHVIPEKTETLKLSNMPIISVSELEDAESKATISAPNITENSELLPLQASNILCGASDNAKITSDNSEVVTDAMESITSTSNSIALSTSKVPQTSDTFQKSPVMKTSELNPQSSELTDTLQPQSLAKAIASDASDSVSMVKKALNVEAMVAEDPQTSDTCQASHEVVDSSEPQPSESTDALQPQPSAKAIASDGSDSVLIDKKAGNLEAMVTESSDITAKSPDAETMTANASEIVQTPAISAHMVTDTLDAVHKSTSSDNLSKASDIVEKTSTSSQPLYDNALEADETVCNVSEAVQTSPAASETVLLTPTSSKLLQSTPIISIKTPEAINRMRPLSSATKQLNKGTTAPSLAESVEITPDLEKAPKDLEMAREEPEKAPKDSKVAPKDPEKDPETLKDLEVASKESEVACKDIEMGPKTSEEAPKELEKLLSVEPSTSAHIRQDIGPEATDEAQQLTDNLGLLAESTRPTGDTLEDMQEFTDSLGLLAESSGPVDEEEEPEMDEDDDGDDEEEGEDDQDDESNHPTADQSEDSNAQTSETDAPNPTDLEISEDSFADIKLGVIGTAAAGGNETAKGEVVDSEMDKALVTPEKQIMKSSSPGKPDGAMDGDGLAPADAAVAEDGESMLRDVLTPPKADRAEGAATPPAVQPKAPDTPSSAKKLSRCSEGSMKVVNIIDLEESSSEDDVQDTTGNAEPSPPPPATNEDVTPDDDVTKNDTVEKPAVPKLNIRLNTDELTIKTAVAGIEPTLVIPEAKLEDLPKAGKPVSQKFSLEVFSLDSDEEDGTKEKGDKEPSPERLAPSTAPAPASASASAPASAPAQTPARCGNPHCRGAATTAAPALKLATKRTLCDVCAGLLDARLQSLLDGVRDLTPLLSLQPGGGGGDLVEISDSDSDEGGGEAPPRPRLGGDAARVLEEQLGAMLNDTWRKFKLDDRLAEATGELERQMAELEKESLDITAMLDECQLATDALRTELYSSFATPQRMLPSIEIVDTLQAQYAKILDDDDDQSTVDSEPSRRSKRPRVPSKEDNQNQAKRPAIPLGFTGDDQKDSEWTNADANAKVDDDNLDIKVVALSAESAPAGLPAPGTLVRQPVTAGMCVYGMTSAFGAWQRASILLAPPRGDQAYSTCKVRFDQQKAKNIPSMMSARNLAYIEPANVRLPIATRVIALSQEYGNKKKLFYSGVIAEMPTPVNNYRYLVFFDGGYAQYVPHCDIRVVCECSPLVWEEVHSLSREFVREYLRAYPERPMVRLHAGQTIKTEWNGKWWVSRVIRVDASLVEVHFEADNRYEWIYRGSTRLAPLYLELQAAERHRLRPLPRSTQGKKNMPYVEYTRFDEQDSSKNAQQQAEQEIRRQRAVAKKSTTPQTNQHVPLPAPALDDVTSRVVYYTPKAAVKPYKMTPHACTIKCRRTDVIPLKELRTYNPLARPLLSGWERQQVRHRGRKEVMYRAPCGRRLRSLAELHRYLRATGADMAVDLFDFSATTHCLAEFVLTRCLVSKKDLSHGKENVPVPCVNYYDTSLPEFCSYNTERTPTAGVPLNLDPDFLCGCDCEDDCQDKSKCNCWKMTLDGARSVRQEGEHVGYVYKRLLEAVPSGIYECNSRCKCKQTCLNRVAQHPLQLKLQVFKTPNRGWGIRALNDVPKGSFLCVYAGNLLTDATANLDGLNEGDEYLAELDYIEAVEQMKEGYEEDIPDRDKEPDNQESDSESESDADSATERRRTGNDANDGDFQPAMPVETHATFSKLLRGRDKKDKSKKGTDAEPPKDAGDRGGERGDKGERGGCITISDDEEVREPSRFMAEPGMGSNNQVSKYRSVRSFFGEDEACYIMDAKVQGNIGRYLNHSCSPNVFVQNVFVDTHDPRFPWVAFFALSHIRAGTELTWNYNYDVGSVPDKVLYCYCGAPNCRGRLL